MLCSEASLVNHGLAAVRVATLRCRCWTCELCRPIRRNQLIAEAAGGLPTRFLTLTTIAIAGGDVVAEARRQGEAFGLLVKRIRARWPGLELEYFVVREATKRGWPHLHVLLRCPFLPWTWLLEQWQELTGSPGVDIRLIHRPDRCARYVAKHFSKAPHRFGTCKRYWCSRGWLGRLSLEEPRRGGWDHRWDIERRTIGQLAEQYWLKGWVVEMDGRLGFFEARAPP